MPRLLLALAALAAVAAVSSAVPSTVQLMERLLQKLEKRHEAGPHGHTHETNTAESSKDHLTHEELRELKAVLMAQSCAHEKRGYKMRQDFAAGDAGDLAYAVYVVKTVKTKGINRVMFDDGKEKEYYGFDFDGLTAEDQPQVHVLAVDTSEEWPSLRVGIRTQNHRLLQKTVKANDVIILS